MERRLEEVIALIDGGARVIALDGRSASGKTTLASSLVMERGVAVVHMDDFFLPPSLRTPERLSEKGGNVHYERFLEEVVPFVRAGKGFSYRRFSCSVMDYEALVEVEGGKCVVVEGAYALHPAFPRYWDKAVFLDITEKEQRMRLEKRNREKLDMFLTRWIPMEEEYFSYYSIQARADLVL